MKTKEEVKGARSTELEVKMTCQSELVEDYTTLRQAQGDMIRKPHKRGQVFHISHFISLILQTCI